MSQLQITFRGMIPSDNLRALAEARFLKVRQRHGQRARCHVWIEPNERSDRGFLARVQLLGQGRRGPVAVEATHDNAVIAMRQAFEKASEQAAPRMPVHAPTRTGMRPRPTHLRLIR